jgi:N-acetylglucosaminylphosphatidylinositol deacetylase
MANFVSSAKILNFLSDCSDLPIERDGNQYADSLVFVPGWRGYRTALEAMRRHESQLVWFRWLYVLFSQYMWLNEWEEVVP